MAWANRIRLPTTRLKPAVPITGGLRSRSQTNSALTTNSFVSEDTAMTYEKIVTLFDSAQHADIARRNLESAGFPSNEISLMSSKTPGIPVDRMRDGAWWRRLFGHDIEDREATAYGTALEAGGVVLTVRVPETEVER